MKVKDVKNPLLQRYARLVDSNKDGELSQADLEAAIRRPDPMKTRLLERALGDRFDARAIRTAADLERLLGTEAPSASGDLPGPSPRYAKLFEGPRSEWVVAFGGDDHHASSEKAPPDVSQYRGFKSFLERQGFKTEGERRGIDDSGFAAYSKVIRAPDGHEHTLTVKVFNSTQFNGAADEFQKTSAERRGYFSLSHAGEGMGMRIGGEFIRPENVLKTPAPSLLIAPIACRSYDHFAQKIEKYLDQNRIPRDKVSYFGASQEIEMTQPDGAFAILKQVFTSALAAKTGPSILKAADDAYNPIMASYDPSSYERDRDRMVMDKDIRAIPVLRGWISGEPVELPSRAAGAPG